MKINLGCGQDIKKGYLNIDKQTGPGVDRIYDLDELPLPFNDNSVEEILCSHIIEHLKDPGGFIHECHRILKPDGIFLVRLPTYNFGCFHQRGIHGKGYFYPVTHKTTSNETGQLFHLEYERPKSFSIKNLLVRIRFMLLHFFAREYEYKLKKLSESKHDEKN